MARFSEMFQSNEHEIWILESQWFSYTRLNEENGVICWHVDLLLGNNHEISNYTTVVAK
jgi:hypothetical protein